MEGMPRIILRHFQLLLLLLSSTLTLPAYQLDEGGEARKAFTFIGTTFDC